MEVTTWPYEEEILPSEETLAATIDGVKGLGPGAWALLSQETEGLGALLGDLAEVSKGERNEAVAVALRAELKGKFRLHQPRALPLAAGATGVGADARPYAHGRAYLVKLGVEFDLPDKLKEAQYRYRRVYYRAWLTAAGENCRPTVLRVYPDRLTKGGPQMVKVELSPSLKWAGVEGSLGGVSADVQVGVVCPATVGFLGDEQRAPYWEMTEKDEAILGGFDFWFVLDVPRGCDPATIRLALLGEGDLKFNLGPLRMGPRRRVLTDRPEITLAQMLPPTS